MTCPQGRNDVNKINDLASILANLLRRITIIMLNRPNAAGHDRIDERTITRVRVCPSVCDTLVICIIYLFELTFER